MSIADTIYQSMRDGCVYRPCDIAAMMHISSGEAGKILKLLAKGGVIEEMRTDEYKRKRIYKTKQRALL